MGEGAYDMLSYGFSIKGKAHIKTGVVCQDANMHGEIAPGLYIGVAADGVGSARHSDIASGLATEKLVKYLENHIQSDYSVEEKMACLKAGYRYAEKAIEEYVKDCDDMLNEYDTTLHVVLYDGRTVIYGHAGDGGILVRTMSGETKVVTFPQKGSDGVSVMPLRAGEKSWKFGCFPERVAAVMLVTDGMLERVVLPHLLNLPTTREEIQNPDRRKTNVYLSATEFFMNPYCVLGNKNLQDPIDLYHYYINGEFLDPEQDWKLYLDCMHRGYESLYDAATADRICETMTASVPLWNIEDTTDDKTVVCLINEDAKIDVPSPEYFHEPDWAKLRKHYEHLLYPAGFGGELSADEQPQAEDHAGDDGKSSKKGGFFKSVFHK